MTDDAGQTDQGEEHNQAPRAESLLARHPRLGILIVAGIFYLILCGMVMTVLVLILRG